MLAATTATLALASARPATPPGDPLDFVLAAVDTTMTPQTWRRTHPTDSLAGDGPTWLPRVQVCRTASGTMTVGGVSVGHLAVFVGPDAPADFALPSDTTLLAARHCLLQSIWIQISAPGANRAVQMADSIAGMIAQRMGPRLEKARGDSIARKEGDPWSRATWQRGNTVTVVGRVPEYGREPAAGDAILWAAAAGTFPSGAGYKHDALNAEYQWSAPDRNPNGGLALDSALAEADLPQTIALEAELCRRTPKFPHV